jgi:hypothetical protein
MAASITGYSSALLLKFVLRTNCLCLLFLVLFPSQQMYDIVTQVAT